MGLDNYFVKMCGPGETAEPLRFDPPLALCVGMLSGGDGSFRGKVYADFVGRVSGLDLYADQNSSGALVEAADAIAAWLRDNPKPIFILPGGERGGDRPDRREVSDLERAFRAYGNAGYCLISWY